MPATSFSSSSYARQSHHDSSSRRPRKKLPSRRLISTTTKTTRTRRERWETSTESRTTRYRSQLPARNREPTASHHGQNEPQFLPGENAEQSWTDVVPWNADRRSYGLSSLRPSSFLPVLEPTTPETRRSRNELAWYLVDGCPYFSLRSNGSHLFFSKFFEPIPVESIGRKIGGSLFRSIITINRVYREFLFNVNGINYESLFKRFFFMRPGISRKFYRVKNPSIWSISSIQPLESAQIVEILWPSV